MSTTLYRFQLSAFGEIHRQNCGSHHWSDHSVKYYILQYPRCASVFSIAVSVNTHHSEGMLGGATGSTFSSTSNCRTAKNGARPVCIDVAMLGVYRSWKMLRISVILWRWTKEDLTGAQLSWAVLEMIVSLHDCKAEVPRYARGLLLAHVAFSWYACRSLA